MSILRIFCVFAMQFTVLSYVEGGKMQLSSPAFESNQSIPKKYSCQGLDVSPPLNISEIPSGTQSLCLIMDDPDAPSGVIDHWITWDITPASTIPEEQIVGIVGLNSFGTVEYKGPCPPFGSVHHYHIKLYAIDVPTIELSIGSTKKQVLNAIQGHILGEAELIGTYKRDL